MRMANDDVYEVDRRSAIVECTVVQRFCCSADRSDRRTQFMRDVGNEVASHALKPSQLGNVVEDHDDTGVFFALLATNACRSNEQPARPKATKLNLAGRAL